MNSDQCMSKNRWQNHPCKTNKYWFICYHWGEENVSLLQLELYEPLGIWPEWSICAEGSSHNMVYLGVEIHLINKIIPLGFINEKYYLYNECHNTRGNYSSCYKRWNINLVCALLLQRVTLGERGSYICVI